MMVRRVILSSKVADSLLEMARLAYPLEMLALLRGGKRGDGVYIEELLFAPSQSTVAHRSTSGST